MELKVVRNVFTENSTIGELSVDGTFECYTLEDKVREEFGHPETFTKIYGETAIPYGRYEVTLVYSSRFKRVLPLLLNVPHFEGILLHSGNQKADTSGCLCVGQTKSPDWIGNSRVALNALFPKIKAAIDAGNKVFIEITK